MKSKLFLFLLFAGLLSLLTAQNTVITQPQNHPKLMQKLGNGQPLLNVEVSTKIKGGQIVKKREEASGVLDAQLAPQRPQMFGKKLLSQYDDRNLPLNSSGKLISPDGYEINFEIPRSVYQNGGCATPVPMIQSGNSSTRANCPIDVPCDLAVNRDASIPTAADPLKYIKLNWTIFQSGGAASNINQTRIDQLMTELNADFLPFRIQFCADPATFVNSPTFYDLNVQTEDAAMKVANAAATNNFLNIYVVNSITLSPGSGAGGYARFPYDPFGGTNIRGGVVVTNNNSVLGTHTLSHEVGHTFGLHHTFRGVDEVTSCSSCYERVNNVNGSSNNGDTEGDWCSDTNPHPINTYVCANATGNDPCTGNAWNNTPFNNHMSYSFCTSQFTLQQAGRMHCMIDSYLQPWLAFGGSTCGNLPPVADFSGAPIRAPAPATVTFTDLSSPPNLITTWTWDFDVANIGGVTPATFTGQNPPAVVYANPGIYTVSLVVSNANGSHTETKISYIEVLTPATDCDTLDGQWTTPQPDTVFYTIAAGNYITGVPNSFDWDNNVATANTMNTDYYERFTTPSPGTSTVGAIHFSLGGLIDADNSITVDFVIYNDNGSGAPDFVGGPIGGLFGISPTTILALSATGFSYFDAILDTPVVITTASFHVGIEMNGVGAGDRLILPSSCSAACPGTDGESDGSNHAGPVLFNYFSNPLGGVNFDLMIYPMMGEWPARTFFTSLIQFVGCDTTLLLIIDTIFNPRTLVSVDLSFTNGTPISVTDPGLIDTLLFVLTSPPPFNIQFATINECGRVDTLSASLTYTLNPKPVVDFTKTQANPVCTGAPGVDFTSTYVGPPTTTYNWDFGDGTTVSVLNNANVNHVYANPGTYYVSLEVIDNNSCSGSETKLAFVEVVDCSITPSNAGFSVNPLTGCSFIAFTFTDNSSSAPDPPTSWLWDFGDGTFSIAQNPPPHTFPASGTYLVTLYTSNAGGTTQTSSSVVAINCPLGSPILLQGMAMGEDAALIWKSEISTEGFNFDMERKMNGNNFEKIYSLLGENAESYSFLDPQPRSKGVVNYRLKVTDTDGVVFYSNQVKIYFDGNTSEWLHIYPNPVSRGNELIITVLSPEEARFSYRLVDGNGRIILKKSQNMELGLNTISLGVSKLATGLYLLEAQNARGQYLVKKVVIE